MSSLSHSSSHKSDEDFKPGIPKVAEFDASRDLLYDDSIMKIGVDSETMKELQKLDEDVSKLLRKINAVQSGESKPLKPGFEAVENLKARLSKFSELREAIHCLNLDYGKLQKSYTEHSWLLCKARDLLFTMAEENENLEGESNEIEALREEATILTRFRKEVELEIQRYTHFLHGLFETFAYISNDVAAEDETILCINASDPDIISDCCVALKLINGFEKTLRSFCDVLWYQFCETLLHAADPDSRLMAEKNGNDEMEFRINTTLKHGEKSNPDQMIGGFKKFFSALHDVFSGVRIEGTPFTAIVGSKLGERLAEKFVLRICAAIITTKPLGVADRNRIVGYFEDFDKFMKEKGFLADDQFSTKKIFTESNRLIVNQQCRAFLSAARNLVFKPCTELVEVSAEAEELWDDFDALSISKESMLSARVDKFSAFQKCSINVSTQKIVGLFTELFHLALNTDEELEAVNFFQAALVVVDTFLISTPRLHQQMLLSVPQTGGELYLCNLEFLAVFYNDCHFIYHSLTNIRWQIYGDESKFKAKFSEYDFDNVLKSLRATAVRILNHHIDSAKRQLSTVMTVDNVFTNIEANSQQTMRLLSALIMPLNQLRSVWMDVMSSAVFESAMGILVGYLLQLIADAILAKEDIKMSDAEALCALLPETLAKCRRVMARTGTDEGIHDICKRPYFRLDEIIFCLKASLTEIEDRWLDGMGPLAEWLKAYELRGLICALFQNTSRRAALLERITSASS